MTMTISSITLTVLSFLSIFSSVAHSQSSEVVDLPLQKLPLYLAERLPEPERSIRFTTADLLHEQQELVLRQAIDNLDNWQSSFLAGVALALEEYWTLELSYPGDFSQLADSEYLLDGWGKSGFQVKGFDNTSMEGVKQLLVYVPQPVGLASLKPVPGMGCAGARRCFETYSLLIPKQNAELWGVFESINTYWIGPFLDRDFIEVMHVSKIDPGMSGCSLCD